MYNKGEMEGKIIDVFTSLWMTQEENEEKTVVID